MWFPILVRYFRIAREQYILVQTAHSMNYCTVYPMKYGHSFLSSLVHSAPSHYLSQCWIINNRSHQNFHSEDKIIFEPFPLISYFSVAVCLKRLYSPGQKFIEFFFCKLLKPKEVNLFGISWIRNETRLLFLKYVKYHIFWFSGYGTVPQINNEQSLEFPMSTYIRVGKMWKRTISIIYWISNKANVFVLKYMKYHTR